MSAPFDTLKLARQFEAAGFEHKQAGDMAAAIAESMLSANLATKADLAALGQQLTIRFGVTTVSVAGLLFGALHLWPPH